MPHLAIPGLLVHCALVIILSAQPLLSVNTPPFRASITLPPVSSSVEAEHQHLGRVSIQSLRPRAARVNLRGGCEDLPATQLPLEFTDVIIVPGPATFASTHTARTKRTIAASHPSSPTCDFPPPRPLHTFHPHRTAAQTTRRSCRRRWPSRQTTAACTCAVGAMPGRTRSPPPTPSPEGVGEWAE